MDESTLPVSRVCTRCGEEKQAAEFGIQRYSDGTRPRLRPRCSECSRAVERATRVPKYAPVVDGVLQCSKCKEFKPTDEYVPDGRKANGRKSRCRTCSYQATAAWRAKNREHLRTTQVAYELATKRRSWLKTKYGLTVEQFEAMVTTQGNVCALCHQPQNPKFRYLDVDHCHATGEVRGLLCRHCNTAIGHFRDDPELLMRAAAYIRGQLF